MMALLGPLAALLGGEVDNLKDRLQRQVVLWGSVAVLGIIAVVFLLVAANTALAQVVGPVIAPLIIAAVAIVIALFVVLVVHLQNSSAAKKEAERRRSTEMTTLIATAAIAAIPLIPPGLRRVAVPAGGLAAAVYSLLNSKTLKRD